MAHEQKFFIPVKKYEFNIVLSHQPGLLICSGPPYFIRDQGQFDPTTLLSAILAAVIKLQEQMVETRVWKAFGGLQTENDLWRLCNSSK